MCLLLKIANNFVRQQILCVDCSVILFLRNHFGALMDNIKNTKIGLTKLTSQ